MNGIQSVIKIFAICLAVFIIVNIFGWIILGISFLAYIDGNGSHETAEVIPADGGQTYIYTEEQIREINKIDIDIKYASVYINGKDNEWLTIHADNLRDNLDVKLIDGKLKIEEDNWSWNKKIGIIQIYLPETMFLSELDIETGAGKLTMDDVYAKKLDLHHGAGTLEISNSEFTKAEIQTGAGKAEIGSCILNNLNLEAGVRKSRSK